MGTTLRASHSCLGTKPGANLANAANVNSETDGYSGSLTTDGGTVDPDNPNSLEGGERFVLASFPYVPIAANG